MATGILDITDAFEKARRNLLLVDSIIVVFWFAAPTTAIKVPGLGTDVSLPSSFAFLLLGASLILFFFPSYWFESRAVSLSHRAISYGANTESLVKRLSIERKKLASAISEAEKNVEIVRETANMLQSNMTLAASRTGKEIFNAADNQAREDTYIRGANAEKGRLIPLEHYEPRLSDEFHAAVRKTLDPLAMTLEEFAKYVATSQRYISNAGAQIDEVNARFATMSRNIARSQRVSFGMMFIVIPWLYTALAIAACLAGAAGRYPKFSDASLMTVHERSTTIPAHISTQVHQNASGHPPTKS